LEKVPAIESGIAFGSKQGFWWIKFQIDTSHQLAWYVVQEFGHILNYISLDVKLPVSFYPVSPPPYLNGGPVEFLSWVIENKEAEFTPKVLQEWLKGRLPDPVDSIESWLASDMDS
jgi:hypothetical protein